MALAGVAVLYAYLFLFTDRDMAALSVVIAQSDRFEEACDLIARTAKLSKREAEILPLALRGRHRRAHRRRVLHLEEHR